MLSATAADFTIRFGVGIPIVAVGLALTFARWYPRRWQTIAALILVANGVTWSTHRAVVSGARSDWAWGGLMVILAFVFVLSREPFVVASIVGAVLIAYHNLIAAALVHDRVGELLFGDFFLVTFAAIGMAAAYGLELSNRLLFLRERQLDRERRRADDLLLNTLPRAIVDRLKARNESPTSGSIAEGHEQVTVLFADLVGFTERSSRTTPLVIVEILDDLFARFDRIADRLGIEKIKTVGDAYMAVAGAPEPRSDHAQAAADMALGIVEGLAEERWRSGEPMQVRIGIASGPAVAGVIGHRKFAYDLWGDTVNLASRLETAGQPGGILVSEITHALLDGRYSFGDPCILDLKGKGPTQAWFLLGRNGA